MVDSTFIPQSSFPADATPESVREFYGKWAETYDKDLRPDSSWPCVANVAKTFTKIVGTGDKDLKILDLGAGTGMVASELKKVGFTNIDALDATPSMLAKAKEKNLYKSYICEVVTAEKPLDIPTGTYDALISCGTITGGHVKANAFDEILRLVKPGGYICFTLRKNAYDDNHFGFAEKFQELTKNTKWKEVSREISDYLIDGSSLDHQKKCFVLCYQVLKNQ